MLTWLIFTGVVTYLIFACLNGINSLYVHMYILLYFYSPGSGTKTQLELIHPGKKARKGHKYHNSGVLYFDNVR